MPNFGTIPPGSPQQEKAYKRGYADGANAALKVLDKNLTEDERSLLGEWATSIADWRAKPERGAFEPPPPPTLR
jgi:hypothetical protein